jgi:chemotaxis family two-component system sensor kinase Cph1
MEAGDEKLLRQIVSNLVSNAIKYSPPESRVEIELDCDTEQAILRVCDHGIGIPESEQAQLFEPFHRASNVGVIAGTGLGLAIVKRAAEAHGGTVTFTSQEAVGTTFTVRLPLRSAPPQRAAGPTRDSGGA